MTALTPALQFRVVKCDGCGEASLPYASGVQESTGEILWSCTRCDHSLPEPAVQAGTRIDASALDSFGYILDGEAASGGCGSDGGGCSSCGSRTKHD
jgi:hypothetical protein